MQITCEMPQKTAFVYHPDYLKHDTGPEQPDRLRASLAALQQSNVWDKLYHIDLTPAGIEQIVYAHNPGYSEHIRQSCEYEIPLTHDTPVGHESYDIALLSIGGVSCADEAVVTKKAKKRLRYGAPTSRRRFTVMIHLLGFDDCGDVNY